ncbi:sulfatase-like hydrolase/transferase [Pseudomonas sp. 148P]|uniref:Sulfatase-like hydrolase/transferase n=1 Tax=Pseudomonas ulcerans TaxID=3115852 RepID=A0ABU7HNW6_9PSED|nr:MULTISPECIES: sulfatase-like hydrolase/transferase [unclassified Pseudomonas]MEE1926156.1 sulfatase-like hydrolase/transferase [Pseudomonas sp. 147P]MEE1933225.1 sulfatase-like hydrolase/transferase [Pseudomonas sp. 148P]
MRAYLKSLLLIAYLACFHEAIVERLQALGVGLALVLYLGVFVLLASGLWLAAQVRQGLLRWLLALVFCASAVFFDAYSRITATYLTYSAFISLVYSGGFIQEAFVQYQDAILLALARGLLLLFGIGLRPVAWPRLPRVLPWAAPLLGLVLLSGILFVRAGEGARGLPVMYTPLAYLNLMAYETLHDHVGARQPVTLPRSGPAMARDIVLLVDESVSGNYLDLNTPHGVPTPLTRPQPGLRIFNYGYAASIANCSADTNVTLRYGGTRADYLRINSTQPSIWQYAHQAGLATVYIDAQRSGGHLQNLMTDTEKRDIDRFIQFDDTPVLQRDMAVAAKLVELLGDGKPQLIVVNKVGAHFPVHDKYPDAFMNWRPALPRGQYADVTDTGSRDGFSGSPDDWVLYRNAYRNTLAWNVGEFFNRLFAGADLSQAVLIYTSDHGQDLHERGNPGLNTHCDSDPVMEEGLVPLVVIQGEGVKAPDWQANLALNRDRSSHYNLFPTLLQLFGYDPVALQALYGRPLSVPTEDDFTFNTRFNARLGASPVFKHIDLGQVVVPEGPMMGSRD